ncbi:hypothetical protein Dimus_019149 [Dionaea muscipula]
MEVNFETQKGISFIIEIGYFDTILEMKEKIEQYRNIPVAKQTLMLDGKVLSDDGDIWKCGIYISSRILVVVSDDQQPPKEPDNNLANKKIVQLLIKLPITSQQALLVMELTDTIELLKQKIQEIEGIPANHLILFINGNTELQDKRSLHDYYLTDGSEITVTVRPSSATTSVPIMPTTTKTSSKKLKVLVMPKCGTIKIPVEVTPSDKVQVLRNELEKLQSQYGFDLPVDGYFFIHRQSLMEERESFQWHNVRQGDIIDIFNGTVTGGT